MALVYVDNAASVDAARALAFKALSAGAIPIEVVLIAAVAGTPPPGLRLLEDRAGRFAERFDAREGTTYLIRPDQHVAARWRAFDAPQLVAAVARATCNTH